jgi:hypothetical protein
VIPEEGRRVMGVSGADSGSKIKEPTEESLEIDKFVSDLVMVG